MRSLTATAEGLTMGWIVEQRAPFGDWFTRATVHDQEAAEHYARLYKDHNPRLRFRYRSADEEDEPQQYALNLRSRGLQSLAQWLDGRRHSMKMHFRVGDPAIGRRVL